MIEVDNNFINKKHQLIDMKNDDYLITMRDNVTNLYTN